MAVISERLQITSIQDKVVLIQDPGRDTEVVLLRFAPRADNIANAMDRVEELTHITDKNKTMIYFWMGYFYAHMATRV